MELATSFALKQLSKPVTDSATSPNPLSLTCPEVRTAASAEAHSATSNKSAATPAIDATDSPGAQDAGVLENLVAKNSSTSQSPSGAQLGARTRTRTLTGSIANWSNRRRDGLRAWLVCASAFLVYAVGVHRAVISISMYRVIRGILYSSN